MAEQTNILEDMLAEWELARMDGRDLSAKDVAHEHPDLVEAVRKEIEVLKATSWVVDGAAGLTERYDDTDTRKGILPESTLSARQFIDAVAETNILPPSELESLQNDDAHTEGEASAQSLAERLVIRGRLTTYQARTLLTKRTFRTSHHQFLRISHARQPT